LALEISRKRKAFPTRTIAYDFDVEYIAFKAIQLIIILLPVGVAYVVIRRLVNRFRRKRQQHPPPEQ